jgi:predicted nucleic acid-binding protein
MVGTSGSRPGAWHIVADNDLFVHFLPHHFPPPPHPPHILLCGRHFTLGLHVSTLSIDEAWWKILAAAYERDHGARSWHSAIVRDNPSVLRLYFPELRKFTTRLLALPRLRGIDQINSKALMAQALDHIRDHSLAPRDAFHLALARAIDVPYIVTNDVQFQTVDANWLSVITFF